ncbi:MAG: nickel pincer cofactor biosynthesis protein LarC [Candidatus Melainabacteria bacterium]|nr:nickel pincer cofactor biosynthesis protein LarC [Candidatus Melainabacteria bacterium]
MTNSLRKTAFFDCQFGAAGDMLIGALISAGLDFDLWLKEVKQLALPWDKVHIICRDVIRCSIAAKKMQVDVMNEDGKPVNEHSYAHQVGHEHSHDHEHYHDHDHDHSNYHEDHFAHDEEHGTSLSQIMEIIDSSNLNPKVVELSKKILMNLAEAEGKVHGISPWKARFHEVGSLDAIVDIVGFAIGFVMLEIEEVHVSAIPLGRGHVKTGHGIFPIPCPAVTNIMAQAKAPVSSFDIPFECLTPTGAAILTSIATTWTRMPAFQSIGGCGYGAGSLDCKDHPNVVRLMIGNVAGTNRADAGDEQSNLTSDTIAVIEANIDDCPPNWLAYTSERLLECGALDVTITPCVMKKGRSAHQISVLCQIKDKAEIEKMLLSETTTLGVRSYLAERKMSKREFQIVKLPENGEIRIKIGRDENGKIVNIQPEYADCADYSLKNSKPLKEVFALALRSFSESAPI